MIIIIICCTQVLRCTQERGADLHMAQLMPLPLTVSCFSKIQISLLFWYRLTRVVPDKGPLNGCVYVCVVHLPLIFYYIRCNGVVYQSRYRSVMIFMVLIKGLKDCTVSILLAIDDTIKRSVVASSFLNVNLSYPHSQLN